MVLSAHCFFLFFIFDSCLLFSFVRLLIGLFGFLVVFQVLWHQCSVRSIASQATIPSCGLSVQPARARMTLSRKELATNAGTEERGISVHCDGVSTSLVTMEISMKVPRKPKGLLCAPAVPCLASPLRDFLLTSRETYTLGFLAVLFPAAEEWKSASISVVV